MAAKHKPAPKRRAAGKVSPKHKPLPKKAPPKKAPRVVVRGTPGPRPKGHRVTPQSKVGFETLFKQTRGRRTIRLMVSTRFSVKRKKRGPEEASRTVKHKTFHEKIHTTRDVVFSSRKHYITLTRKDLKNAGKVKAAVLAVMALEGKRFSNSKYDRFAASIQLLSGKLINPDTGFLAKSGFASNAIRMPAESRQKTKLKKETLKQSTRARIQNVAVGLVNNIESMALELHGSNMKRRKPSSYKSSYRGAKRNEGEQMETKPRSHHKRTKTYSQAKGRA